MWLSELESLNCLELANTKFMDHNYAKLETSLHTSLAKK